MPCQAKVVQRCEEDEFRPKEPWQDKQDKERLEGDELKKKKELVYNIRALVEYDKTDPAFLKDKMGHDAIFNMTPAGQLEWCVEASKGYNAGTLAKCLYTSYFYRLINGHLRVPNQFEKADPAIQNAIRSALAAIEDEVRADTVLHDISHKRVELLPEWMKDPKVGGEVNFPAFTSMHRNRETVVGEEKKEGALKTMSSDIKSGAFGKYTTPTVLKLVGKSKLVRPTTGDNGDIKYFPNEREDILPPGSKAKVVKIETKKKDYFSKLPPLTK